MEEENALGLPAIDRIANGEQFLMLKAALPFLEQSIQQPLAVYIKIMELQNILHFYQRSSDMSACSVPSSKSSLTDMLQEMSRYLQPGQTGTVPTVYPNYADDGTDVRLPGWRRTIGYPGISAFSGAEGAV